jgi:hypothetical protein
MQSFQILVSVQFAQYSFSSISVCYTVSVQIRLHFSVSSVQFSIGNWQQMSHDFRSVSVCYTVQTDLLIAILILL